MMNPNWPRWIFSCISKHFADHFATNGIPLFIEGQHRDTSTFKDFVELRTDGPDMLQMSKNFWKLRVEVNILVQSTMDETNYHRIHQNVGIVSEGFTTIQVLKKGNGPEDDGSFVGCLKLLQNRGNRDLLEINHFGQIDVATKLMQSTVEGHYEMCLLGG